MACSTGFKPRALFGNLQKVFLQVRIKTRDRDPNQTEKSLICKAHLQIDTALILLRRNITRSFKKLHYPTEVTEVAEIKDDLHVDKMIARGDI